MSRVGLQAVSKRYHLHNGTEVTALNGLHLEIRDGELIVILGSSGCGKTTLLRVIAGLETPDCGVVSIDSTPVNALPPEKRNVSMVFQRDALYPHMTVFENMAFGLRLRNADPDQIRAQVEQMSKTLRIEALLARTPATLSGGQRQRVALGRALVRMPAVLLLDEPLSHLDGPLRAELRNEISRIQNEAQVTTVFVTHDPREASKLADASNGNPCRLAIMADGKIEQIGSAQSVFQNPASDSVQKLLLS
jgi:ABC-type sugar transport system ATPase subunit